MVGTTVQKALAARQDRAVLLAWTDVVEMIDSHGFRPMGRDKSDASDEAHLIHAAYGAWVAQQGLRPDHRYVMPLRLLYMWLASPRDGRLLRGRAASERSAWARRVIVNVLNEPTSGLEVLARPVRSGVA